MNNWQVTQTVSWNDGSEMLAASIDKRGLFLTRTKEIVPCKDLYHMKYDIKGSLVSESQVQLCYTLNGMTLNSRHLALTK